MPASCYARPQPCPWELGKLGSRPRAELAAKTCGGNDIRMDRFLLLAFVLACLTACEQPAPSSPQIRSVRAVTVERRVISEPVVLIGQIRARDEISLAFRIDGKLVERTVAPGDRIDVGRLVARLARINDVCNVRIGPEQAIT